MPVLRFDIMPVHDAGQTGMSDPPSFELRVFFFEIRGIFPLADYHGLWKKHDTGVRGAELSVLMTPITDTDKKRNHQK
jgi:hypothetical protein